MADEASISSRLNIINGNLRYQTTGGSFQADVTGAKGPTPGAITASLTGTDVDLSQLTQPGLCEITNQDETNIVEVGIYEPATGSYYPMLELLPGETYVMRLSRNIREQFDGTVTGTGTYTENNTLRVKAYGAAVNVFVGAFES